MLTCATRRKWCQYKQNKLLDPNPSKQLALTATIAWRISIQHRMDHLVKMNLPTRTSVASGCTWATCTSALSVCFKFWEVGHLSFPKSFPTANKTDHVTLCNLIKLHMGETGLVYTLPHPVIFLPYCGCCSTWLRHSCHKSQVTQLHDLSESAPKM